MDVVYNHTFAVQTSDFDKIVPQYYYRTNFLAIIPMVQVWAMSLRPKGQWYRNSYETRYATGCKNITLTASASI